MNELQEAEKTVFKIETEKLEGVDDSMIKKPDPIIVKEDLPLPPVEEKKKPIMV